MPLLGALGLGLLRRWLTVALCTAAFWAGTELQYTLQVDRCLDAGGTVDPRGLCRGLR